MQYHLRLVLLTALVIPFALVAAQPAAESTNSSSRPIVQVVPELNHIQKWNTSNGDTGDPFWADDDRLYTFMCDGSGFGKGVMNLNFNQLEGQDLATLKGIPINPMAEYGKGNQKEADNATWKVCGQECIDGVFYGFVSRNVYGKDNKSDKLMRQSSFNASLIKSTDRGRTWTRTAKENYDSPMWPGTRFGAPSFIHYGKDGGSVTKDEADKYVYAISNNGFWNGGDDFILARIERNKLPLLQSGDWTYYTGNPSVWSPDIAKADLILKSPAQLGWTSPCYIPALERYLLVSWYVTPTLKKWFEPGEVKYDFYEAPHPWGPWNFVSSLSDRFMVGGHMYGPNICAKYQQTVGKDVQVSLFTSGCPFDDKPSGLYKLWRIPLTLKTAPPQPTRRVNDDDPTIRYQGAWQSLRKHERRYHQDDIHATQGNGDSLEFTFNGTGIEVISERYGDLGDLEIFIDDASQGTVELALDNFPRLVQIPVFSALNLTPGKHTLRIVNRGNDWAVVDGFRIHGGH